MFIVNMLKNAQLIALNLSKKKLLKEAEKLAKFVADKLL